MDLAELLQLAVEENASDLHLQAGMPPMLRVTGELQPVGDDAVSAQDVESLLRDGLPEEEAAHVGDRDYQTAFDMRGVGRIRVSLYRQNRGVAASLRIIPQATMSLTQIGAPDGVKDLTKLPWGLVMVTGPTGSGKTTTIAAMLADINKNRAERIVYIGDPIEFSLPPGASIVILREVGVDTDSFAAGCRAVLRQDPDVIHVSEMRDLPTVMMCLTLAEAGHLVLTTLHCVGVAQAVRRLIEVFPSEQRGQIRTQLAASLRGIVAQRLLPRAKGRGRVAAYEVLIGTPEVQQVIRQEQMLADGTPDYMELLESNAASGMMSFDQSLAQLVKSGEVALGAATPHASSPERLKKLVES